MRCFIVGKFQKIIYSSDNFHVVSFKIDANQEAEKKALEIEKVNNIRVISYDKDFDLNLTYRVELERKPSKKYQFSYVVMFKEIVVKTDYESVISYLCSKMFKGISIATATKLVENLGCEFIKEPMMYKDQMIELIGEKKTMIILNAINNKTDFETLYHEFIANNLSTSILNHLNVIKKNVIRQFITQNIFDLVEISPTLNFFEINNIAAKYLMSYSDELSNQWYLLWILINIENKGSTVIKIDDLFLETKKYKTLEKEQFKQALKALRNNQKIVVHDDKKTITSSLMFDKETYIVNCLLKIANYQTNSDVSVHENNLDDVQNQALINSLKNNFSIITGGPGTGKTLMIKILIENAIKLGHKKIVVLAPTGKSAIQATTKTNFQCKTIHSFLKYNETFFEVNENHPSDAEFMIIDEFSMIDIHLMHAILIACPKLKHLILVGDENQLPSVGPGYLLNDLIISNIFVVNKLQKIYRQKEGSLIAENGKNIKDSMLPNFDNKEVVLINDYGDDNIAQEHIINYIHSFIKSNNDIFNQQILIPIYKHKNGIDEINQIIQEIINKNNPDYYILNNDRKIYIGDKVIQIENDNDKEVYNGEIGAVQHIELDEKENIKKITVQYPNKKIDYTLMEFNKMTYLAYAISIHKFQGSECSEVVILLPKAATRIITKKMFYTAFTRAMNKLSIISNLETIQTAINNDDDSYRKCNLLKIIETNKNFFKNFK